MPTPAQDDSPRRSERWHRRRREIVDRSARVFAQRGYDATGTVDLCDANELGKGALYHYIGSKETVLTAIFDRVMDEVMAGADAAEAPGGTPTERLRRLGAELLGVIARFPDHVWVSLHEFRALTGDRAEQYRHRRREFEARIEAILIEGIAVGEFRDVDPHVTALGWLGMHNYTYRWMLADGVPADRIAAAFADLVIRGLSTAPASTASQRTGSQRPAHGAA